MRIYIDLLTHYEIDGTHVLKQVPIQFFLYESEDQKYAQE